MSKKEAQGYPFASEAEAKVTDRSSKIDALGVRMCCPVSATLKSSSTGPCCLSRYKLAAGLIFTVYSVLIYHAIGFNNTIALH